MEGTGEPGRILEEGAETASALNVARPGDGLEGRDWKPGRLRPELGQGDREKMAARQSKRTNLEDSPADQS